MAIDLNQLIEKVKILINNNQKLKKENLVLQKNDKNLGLSGKMKRPLSQCPVVWLVVH